MPASSDPGPLSVNPQTNERKALGDREVEALVRGLDNLNWNLHVQAEIFRLGQRAVPALASFLNGPPSQFPDGRVLAAEALGRIGGEAAFEGLCEALVAHPLEALSPVLRLSEETVQSAVARELGRIGDRRAAPLLLDALRRSRLLGAADALVQWREPDALPWLIEGLEDAFKRDRLSEIILKAGPAAVSHLIATLEHRVMRHGDELLPSIERRAQALKLLGLLDAKEARDAMAAALRDPHEVVRMEAAIALVAVAESALAVVAAPALLAGLNHPDFIQRDRCADALVRIGPQCARIIEKSFPSLTVHARTSASEVLRRLNER